METPVAIIIFNRAHTAERVFERIAAAKPKKLLVIADGPRPDHPDDEQQCAAARAVVDRIDWDCEVMKNFSEKNLGCGQRPASGITWIFENVDRAVILEDDCVPHPSFFRFCEEMLDRYQADERIMHISGRSVFPETPQAKYSYYFSRSLSGWGWATWARAWKYYDINIPIWPELRGTRWLEDTLGDPRAVKFFNNIFNHAFAHQGNLSYWDQQWNFTCWSQNGLGIRPYANLVEYIGFEDATHRFWGRKQFLDFPVSEMAFPLKHPPFLVRDREADQFNTDRVFPEMERNKRRERNYQLYQRVKRKLKKILGINRGA